MEFQHDIALLGGNTPPEQRIKKIMLCFVSRSFLYIKGTVSGELGIRKGDRIPTPTSYSFPYPFSFPFLLPLPSTHSPSTNLTYPLPLSLPPQLT